ncbi:hypothetical protein LX69_01088 [Breznakibacter xylanolyticus]|uniref:Uncharacterized protein n=1 Tax=Breznakibacter xylanolyticus TaxID=990 RepID=A0A2W7NEY7_9BACT|nr:hypothetical protein [Breznakibacter xylanolyticus]PZX18053.1 hypothetical protein LX69_01088 [Breznakibacter xylanolyticus]
MKRYVEQLLEDIEAAQNSCYETLALWAGRNEVTSIEDMMDPDAEGGITPEELFGIDLLALPPDSYLDEEELWELSLAFSQLWRAHGLYPVFTRHLPKRIKYNLFRDYWQQPVYPSPGDKVDVEMCDHEVCSYCDLCPVCKSQNSMGLNQIA